MGNKVVGIVLALCSGLFIGVSFVFKKKGLLNATATSHGVAGQGHAYLKNWTWWLGMTLMIVGEICNFIAYAFTEAILVTPLGALSVVVAAVGSSIFLQERLSFVGKIGCALCILGAVVIVLNAPAQTSVSTIQEMQRFVLSKVFLPYACIIILIAVFLAYWVAPRYGQKHLIVYISICSIIGGISVVCTQGFGASVVSAISGVPNQWNQWFLWVLLIFVVATLLVEINYLNKALNIFNTSVVTPIYFTYFTTMTLISSAVLFQGFNGSAVEIITVVLGFLTVVAGVVLLQVSLAASNKSDSAMLKAELNDVQDVLQHPVDDDQLNPGPAAIRGALSVRRFNTRNVSIASQINELQRRRTLSSSVSSSTGRLTSHEGHFGAHGMSKHILPTTETTNVSHGVSIPGPVAQYEHHNTIRFVGPSTIPHSSYERSGGTPQVQGRGSIEPMGTNEKGETLSTTVQSPNLPVELFTTPSGSLHDSFVTYVPPGPRVAPRSHVKNSIFKQFSFARGRKEEEKIGLTTTRERGPKREKSESPSYQSHSESESDLEDRKYDRE